MALMGPWGWVAHECAWCVPSIHRGSHASGSSSDLLLQHRILCLQTSWIGILHPDKQTLLISVPLTPEICMSTSLLYPQPSCSSLPSLTSLLSFLLGASRYTQVGEFGLFHKWTSPGQRAGRERGPASGLHQSCPLPEPSIMSS